MPIAYSSGYRRRGRARTAGRELNSERKVVLRQIRRLQQLHVSRLLVLRSLCRLIHIPLRGCETKPRRFWGETRLVVLEVLCRSLPTVGHPSHRSRLPLMHRKRRLRLEVSCHSRMGLAFSGRTCRPPARLASSYIRTIPSVCSWGVVRPPLILKWRKTPTTPDVVDRLDLH